SKRNSQRHTWRCITLNKEKAKAFEPSSPDLPSTYKRLMEKAYTWVEAREKRPQQKKEACESWRDGGNHLPTPSECQISGPCRNQSIHIRKASKQREQSWPLEEIPLEITIGEGPITVTKTLTFVIVKADSPHNLLLGRTAMQQIGIVVSTVYGAIKFHTPRGIGTIFSKYNSQKPKEEEGGSTNKYQGNEEIILSCMDIEERVVINDKYPEQKITIGRQLPTRIKIRLRDLLKRYIDVFAWTSAHITGVEELTGAGILREVKYETWVSNPMVVKKDNGKWKLRVDFTNINKACIREPHTLPAAEQKAEGLHKYRLKCFLDAYKGYHQIPIAEEDKEKTTFFTREGVFCYKRLPFGLKNAGSTYQRLINKVFGH
ncbi:reverse transcriptase domain-containing protein, partial [Tanacetum coccineum]